MWRALIIIGITVVGGLCDTKVLVKLLGTDIDEIDVPIPVPCHEKHVGSCAKVEVFMEALIEENIQVPGNITLKIHSRASNSATFKSDDGSEAVFAWDRSLNIAGHVQSLALGQTFYLETCGRRCYVWITMDGQWEEEQEIVENYIDNGTTNEMKRAEDMTTEVTYSVMVWYTPEFRQLFSDEGAMNVFVDLIFAETNQGYENSEIPVRTVLHCLKPHPTLHDIEDSGDMLSAFKHSMSMSELHASADAANLLVADFSSCGIAYTDTTGNCHTLSVVMKRCATGYYSFGHEIGHNFGAKHNAEQYDEEDLVTHPYLYGHGFLMQPPGETANSGYRSILSYTADHHKHRVNYYSSPNIIFPATSSSTGEHPYADNARVITDNRFSMAACGDESSTCDTKVPEKQVPQV